MGRGYCGGVADGLGRVFIGRVGGVVGAVDLLSVRLCEGCEYGVWAYLHHGFFDTVGLDEPVLLEVVDESFVARAGAAPRHAECSSISLRCFDKNGGTAREAGELC